MSEGFHAPLFYTEGTLPARFIVFVDENGGHSGILSEGSHGDVDAIDGFWMEGDRFVYAINVKPKVTP